MTRAALGEALRGLQEELRGQIRSADDASRPIDLDEPIGRLSRMDAIQQQAMVKANREAAKLRLQQVEAALRRYEDDEYGDCLACGEPIGASRLRARPEAPFCIGCQTLREA